MTRSAQNFDFRNSTITNSVQGVECPAPRYAELAAKRFDRADGVLNLFRLDDIVAVNRNPTVLGQGGGRIALGSARPLIPNDIDGPEHAKWRRLLDPMFSPKRVAALETSIRSTATELIERFESHGEVDLTEGYCVPLPALVFLRILGAPVDDLAFFLDIKEQTIHAKGETGEEIAANAAVGGAKLIEYFTTLLQKRREHPASDADLIGFLTTARVDGEPISDEQLIDILFVVMLAGLDTVAGMLSLIFSHLARHPELRQLVVDDPGRIPVVVEEIMRVETPVPAVNRYATEDIDLGDGLVVRKGEVIHAMLAGANVDERAFTYPLTVDPDRGRTGHIAFASGVHRCLGSHLARAEMRIALEEFHCRFPRYEVKPGTSPRYQNVTIRMAHDLVLRLEAVTPS